MIKNRLDNSLILESKIITKVNARGVKRRRVRCRPGYKLNSTKTACVPITGGEKSRKRLAVRKMLRTKKSKGRALQIRTQRKRKKAMRRRKAYGLKNVRR